MKWRETTEGKNYGKDGETCGQNQTANATIFLAWWGGGGGGLRGARRGGGCIMW